LGGKGNKKGDKGLNINHMLLLKGIKCKWWIRVTPSTPRINPNTLNKIAAIAKPHIDLLIHTARFLQLFTILCLPPNGNILT